MEMREDHAQLSSFTPETSTRRGLQPIAGYARSRSDETEDANSLVLIHPWEVRRLEKQKDQINISVLHTLVLAIQCPHPNTRICILPVTFPL